ncbi:MAG TPA: carbohydrate ABC transporter permease [Deltaproteobacteria bacterium]|jgi:alpha-glucoside transport system permease protein|nr:carbohydrate ABC transporter permease [SAR324 cluster bacterium]HBL55876.1 alpha-glucoside ABC transporter permease [Deltaproteobacteria bacterium]HHZ79351.1 carbohydrate ABC transporter permease [Candidatus Lambdaproteobacteria bacterium]HIN46946.1 carbohydrate ABC transporter permease [Deltaproteobacteria bacterium]HIO61327.1 carbohydrate ABC transporter permease [Deltaproteobacteria bacterium]
MSPLSVKSFNFGRILNSTGLLVLVLLWILPTVGLLVSSLRDKDELALTGWWTALSTSARNEFRRTGISEDQVEIDGKYIISGKLLEPGGKIIQTFSTNFRNLTAYEAGATAKFKDGSLFTLQGNGDYVWISDIPFKHNLGKRIFYVAKVPPTFSLDNYREVLASEGVGQSFINTMRVTIPATVIPIMIASFAAYAFAWMKFPGRQFLFVCVVGLLVVPLQMSLIPLLSMYNDIGNYFGFVAKSYPGIWLAHTGFGLPLAIYWLRNYMGSLPREIIESARIDGATHFQIFTRLVLPLSVPALASFCIFQFLWVWNDLLVALVFLGKHDNQIVLTSKLRELLGSRGDNWEILTSSAFISIIIPLLVFFTLQRYFVRGLVTGSVKS